MPRYILLSFALMGFAFYELSGGSDFVPTTAPAPGEILAKAPIEMTPLEKAREARAAQTIAGATENAPAPASAPVPEEVSVASAAPQPRDEDAERTAGSNLRVTLPTFATLTGTNATGEQVQPISLNNGLSDIAGVRRAEPETVYALQHLDCHL